MLRASTLALLLLSVPVGTALATRQVEERIVVDGRVHRMAVTPLEPLLDQRGKRIRPGERVSTNLYRGYVGTWLLEGDRLYLASLIYYADEEREGHEHPVRVEKDIPLSAVFEDRPGPIPATWWSGQIMVSQGNLIRSGPWHGNHVYEKTLYLNVKDGQVAARRVVDNREEGRGLSPQDIQWVTRVATSPEDDCRWHDARSIRTEAFRKAVPTGTSFRTRGYLAVVQKSPPCLYVSATPSTDLVRLPLRALPEAPELRSCPHAELTVTWEEHDGDVRLCVAAWRALAPGETMHHPDFVVLERFASNLPAEDEEPDPNLGTKLRDAVHLHALFGNVVSLGGPVVRGEITTIHGVEVEADEALDPKPAVAAGLLQKWIVTPALLERDSEVSALFATRGPGTWYRLVHPATGRLSHAHYAE